MIAGIFHILEVPILKERFDVSNFEISLIFVIAGLADLVAIAWIKENFIERHGLKVFYFSAIGLVGISILYLNNYTYFFVYLIIVVFGFLSGGFSLSQTTLAMGIDNSASRTRIFIFLRLATQLGLFFATLVIHFTKSSIVQFSGLNIAAIISIFSIFVLSISWKQKVFKPILKNAPYLIILLLYSIAPKNAPASEFIVPVEDLPKITKPSKNLSVHAAFISSQIFDTLYDFNGRNTLSPNIAQSHSISPNGLRITIQIKRDKQFSDGTQLNSEHVVRSLVSSAKELGERAFWAFSDVKGFSAFLKSSNEKDFGIKAISRWEVQIDLEKPSPRILQMLSASYFSIFLNKNGSFLGSGLYKINKENENFISLRKIEDKGKHTDLAPNTVKFIKTPRKNHIVGLRSGQFSIAQTTGHAKAIFNQKKFQKINFSYLHSILLLMNSKSKVFKDSSNRCLFGQYVRESISKTEYGWTPADLGNPKLWKILEGNSKDSGSTRFPSKKRIKIIHANSVGIFAPEENEKIRVQLAKKRINVSFEPLDISDLAQQLVSGKFEAAILGYLPDYLDIDAILTPAIKTGQQYNFMKYSNPIVDNLIDLSRSLDDRQSRNIVLENLFSVLRDECPLSFLGSQEQLYEVSRLWILPSISGLGLHKLKFRDVKWVGKE